VCDGSTFCPVACCIYNTLLAVSELQPFRLRHVEVTLLCSDITCLGPSGICSGLYHHSNVTDRRQSCLAIYRGHVRSTKLHRDAGPSARPAQKPTSAVDAPTPGFSMAKITSFSRVQNSCSIINMHTLCIATYLGKSEPYDPSQGR